MVTKSKPSLGLCDLLKLTRITPRHLLVSRANHEEKRMTLVDWVASFLAVIAAAAAVLIGIAVWFGERSNRLRVIFLWLTVFVALWIVSNVVYAHSIQELRFPLALVSYTAAVFVATTTLVFVLRLVHHT